MVEVQLVARAGGSGAATDNYLHKTDSATDNYAVRPTSSADPYNWL
jgi:hypothetical protein